MSWVAGWCREAPALPGGLPLPGPSLVVSLAVRRRAPTMPGVARGFSRDGIHAVALGVVRGGGTRVGIVALLDEPGELRALGLALATQDLGFSLGQLVHQVGFLLLVLLLHRAGRAHGVRERGDAERERELARLLLHGDYPLFFRPSLPSVWAKRARWPILPPFLAAAAILALPIFWPCGTPRSRWSWPGFLIAFWIKFAITLPV